MILFEISLFIQEIKINLIVEEVEKMSHDKVYATCENMCLEETMTKEQIEAAINNAGVKDGGITTSKIADSAVTTTKINNKAVTTDKLDDKAITKIKIADGAISRAKLEDYVINESKIVDRAISTDKLGYQVVTDEKLDPNAVFVEGTYTGNGQSRHIDLGFKPRLVLIIASTQGLQATLTENGASVSYINNETVCCEGRDTSFDETGLTIDSYDPYNKVLTDYTYIAFK